MNSDGRELRKRKRKKEKQSFLAADELGWAQIKKEENEKREFWESLWHFLAGI